MDKDATYLSCEDEYTQYNYTEEQLTDGRWVEELSILDNISINVIAGTLRYGTFIHIYSHIEEKLKDNYLRN